MASASLSADEDVLVFLKELGLEHLAATLTENGFYTSLDALSAATFDELLDCNIRPVHAKLIMSALKSKGAPEKEPVKLAAFLRSVGLEHCHAQLVQAELETIEAVKGCSLRDLIDGGLTPVHARLIVANLDSVGGASSEFDLVTPARGSETRGDEDALLGGGGGKRREQESIPRFGIGFLILALLLAGVAGLGFFAAHGRPAVGAATGAAEQPRLEAQHGEHGKRIGRVKGGGKALGKGAGLRRRPKKLPNATLA